MQIVDVRVRSSNVETLEGNGSLYYFACRGLAMSRSNPTSWMSIAFLWFRHYACLMKRQHLGQYNMGLDLIWVFFVGFSVWGTFPFYLLHFGAKTFPLLNFGAKIYHLHYSSMFSMVFKSMVLHNLSMVFIDVFRGFTHFFHSVH